MKLLLAILLLTLAGCGGCASVPEVPTHDELRDLALWLVMERKDGTFGGCGGTPIAADTVVTARHCVEGAARVTIFGLDPVDVAKVEFSGRDRAHVRLTKPVFKKWAEIGPEPKQGDRVRWWGNPHGIPDVYRVGVVIYTGMGVVVTDAQACHGDSGSALFNDAGQIVGVIWRLAPDIGVCKFTVAEGAK